MDYFLTGTDTGVGKTYVGVLLVRALRRAGFDTVGLKPVCCGGREDAGALRQAAAGELSLDEVNPVWLPMPAAPLVAGRNAGLEVNLEAIRAAFARVRAARQSVIVEGVGGWFVPILKDYFVADMAAEMGLPVVVVAANRLGVINHTLLTVRAIQERGLRCAGVILNNLTDDRDPATSTNRAVLEELLDVPILHEVAAGQTALGLAVA